MTDHERDLGAALDEYGLPRASDLGRESSLAEVDHAVIGYRRKLAGLDPWPDFEAMVPASVRAQATRAA